MFEVGDLVRYNDGFHNATGIVVEKRDEDYYTVVVQWLAQPWSPARRMKLSHAKENLVLISAAEDTKNKR